MKKVTLVRGLPGAGKTTFAKKLRDEITASGTTAIWLESSMYTSETGIRILSTSQTPVVTGWLLNKVSDAFVSGRILYCHSERGFGHGRLFR